MSYTEFFFDKDYINRAIDLAAANLKQNKGSDDLLGFALGVISRRLERDSKRYRDYGVYWPALKEVLRQQGYDGYGDPVYPLIADVYRGHSDIATVVQADQFRGWYLRTQAIGTCHFVLDSSSPDFTIITDDFMDGLEP